MITNGKNPERFLLCVCYMFVHECVCSMYTSGP